MGKIKVVSSPEGLRRIENSCHAHSLALPFHRRTLKSFTILTSVVIGRSLTVLLKITTFPVYTTIRLADGSIMKSEQMKLGSYLEQFFQIVNNIFVFVFCALSVPCNSLHSLHLGSQSHCVNWDYQKASVLLVLL